MNEKAQMMREKFVNKAMHILKTEESRDSDSTDVIRYALITVFNETEKIILLILLFLLTDRLIEFLFCLLTFGFIRIYAGGSHRSTFLGCFFQSYLTFSVIIFLSEHFMLAYVVKIASVIISALILYLKAPIESKLRGKYSQKRRREFKKKTIISVVVVSIFGILVGNIWFNYTVWCIIIQTCEMMVICIVRNA